MLTKSFKVLNITINIIIKMYIRLHTGKYVYGNRLVKINLYKLNKCKFECQNFK